MSNTESLGTESANFFVATKQEPRFNLRGRVDFDKGENAATIIAANALRGHEDISVSRKANVTNRFFVNGVHVGDQHNWSLSANENEISLTDKRFAFEFLAEMFEKLLLSGAQEVIQDNHAGTSLL